MTRRGSAAPSLRGLRGLRPAALAAVLVAALGLGLGACSDGDDPAAEEPAPKIPLTGTVVDADGAPVADAAVATTWLSSGGRMSPMEDVVTDADGRFTLEVDAMYTARDVALIARSDDGAQMGAGLAASLAGQGHEPAAIVLAPTVRWEAELTVPELDGGEPDFWSVSVLLPAALGGGIAAHLRPDDGAVAFEGAPLDYRLLLGGEGLSYHQQDLPLSEATGVVDGGVIELERSTIARLAGRPAPAWTVTAARNTGGNATPSLEDFRGRWILLEFWGFW